jgi:serine/threonine-protein kinase
MRESIGHYRILDRIGGGAMGDVYRARDTKAGRTVAVRILKDEIAGDPERRRRFLQDARGALNVSHPNIAALFDVGEDEGLLYLVSEFVPGESLRSVVGGRPLNPHRAIDLAAQAADAIAHAHAHGMVHGDLRLDTIVVTPKGRVRIMEPGFAAWESGVPGPGSSGSDRSDIAALGTVLVEMLTGGSASHDSRSGTLPPEIDRIVARMLAPDGDEAFASAAVVAAELRAVATDLAARTLDQEPPPQIRKPSRSRQPWLVLVLVVGILALVIWIATR